MFIALNDLITVRGPLKIPTPLRTQTQLGTVHGHPFYLVCPGMLSLVGELLSGDGCGSSNRIYSRTLDCEHNPF